MIAVENIRKIYPCKCDTTVAIENISFSLQPGERLGIVGASGSGKSTLLRLLALFEEPTAGTIHFSEQSVLGLSRKGKREVYEQMQMVFQNPSAIISPRMTLEEFMWEPLRNFGKEEGGEERIRLLLDEVGLPYSILERLPHEVSGGQLQRIAIARALLLEPKVLLLDEPTSALDVTTQAKILELLDRLWKIHGFAYILVSHDMAVVRQMTDRMLVMKHGQLVEEVSKETSLDAVGHDYTKQLIYASFCGC